MKRGGYTLFELVVVLAIAALLAGVAAPRIMQVEGVQSFSAARRLAADIRYAQRLAMTKHVECGVEVTGASSYRVFEGAPGTPAMDPLTREGFEIDLATVAPGVTIAPSGGTVTFDARGRPKAGFTASFTVGGRSVVVEDRTGSARY